MSKLYQWYRIPIDYNENDEIQPKYADGYNITYFGDRPFKGFSGVVIDGYYIVKIYADENIHRKLQEQHDVIVLNNKEVKDILNYRFMKNYSFETWNSKFGGDGIELSIS